MWKNIHRCWCAGYEKRCGLLHSQWAYAAWHDMGLYHAVPRMTAALWRVYKIMDNCWLIGWSDTFIKCLNHEIAVSTVIVIPVALCCPWNFIFSTQEHLRWMIQKDSLGQDIFLLGHVQIRVCGDGRGSFIKTLLPAISGSRWMDWAFK